MEKTTEILIRLEPEHIEALQGGEMLISYSSEGSIFMVLENGHGYLPDSNLICLGLKHIEALQDGKMLAWHDSEYSTFVALRVPQPTGN